MKKNVSIIGLGYIGLPTSIILAQNDYKVFGYDKSEERIQAIRTFGKFLEKEPNQAQYLSEVLNHSLFIGNTLRVADCYLIVVPTPINDKKPVLDFVYAALEELIPILKEGDLIILESTCPVGTTQNLANRIFKKRSALKDKIYIAYCPERVIPGNTFFELKNNDRVIGGIDEKSSQKALEFYKQFVSGNLYKTTARTAELCKLTENSYRDHQIAFANEISIICDQEDINPYELIELANKHPRISILSPGCGVGGHCIAVDPWFLISQYESSTLIEKSRETNLYKTQWCIDKIKLECKAFELQNFKKPNLSIMGLTYKPNIDDIRESPAFEIAQTLKENNSDYQNIYLIDPNLENTIDLKLCQEEELFLNADIIVFLVKHESFKIFSKKLNNKQVIDFCGIHQFFKGH